MTTPATAPRSNGCPSSITVISHGSIARSCCSLSPALSAPARPWPCARPAANLDPSRHVFIYLANPTIGVRGMLTHIVATLGHTPAFHRATLAPQAADALATEHAERGRNPVLVVDEAHLLDNQQLEAIRLLTNHEMDSGSPFAVILVGQPSLRHRLRLGVLAALDQRIAVRYAIAGMSGRRHRRLHPPSLQNRRTGRHPVLRGRDRADPQRVPRSPPRGQQPRPACADRRVRRRTRHRPLPHRRARRHLVLRRRDHVITTPARGYPRAVNNLAVHALTAAFAGNKAIVDEKSARIAVTETDSD